MNTPRVDYKPSEHPVRVDLGRGWSRGEGTDRLFNIRCLNGSRYVDVVTGTARGDALDTGAGSDPIQAQRHILTYAWMVEIAELTGGLGWSPLGASRAALTSGESTTLSRKPTSRP